MKINRLFYCLLFLSGLVLGQRKISLTHFSQNKIMVVAHRADWREAPENSVMAVRKAMEIGVNMVEIDLALTKDSILVLMHDATIDRTTTGKGKPSDYTLEELKKLNLRDGLGVPTQMKVPTLEEILDLTKGKIFVNLDKAFDYFNIVYPILKKREQLDEILFKGTAPYEEFDRKYGKIKNEIHYMPIVRLNKNEGWSKINDYLEKGKVYGFELTLGPDESHLINFMELRKKGARIWVNSLWPQQSAGHYDDLVLDDPEAYEWYVKNNINIIQTDRPKELIRFLKKKNLYSEVK
ncbi:glycerophosphodiester phosphodiesterase family protein [Chryseobacterium sp. Tr-659]|uniref:glycerophosphodiester phosphodiesterase family protein n=1 Tax=Chryseobacterium sp. Tr-659 TaxID=2608340 RepID=UPI0014210D3D|nr:glycerophosphodiester phosphodiesterase family protein [Chryseobacterium sp. Tr-659]NIF06535.1 glycerophosphodiester phosphodiesterase family protein [Chryseobacterium sp. Tr-659]